MNRPYPCQPPPRRLHHPLLREILQCRTHGGLAGAGNPPNRLWSRRKRNPRAALKKNDERVDPEDNGGTNKPSRDGSSREPSTTYLTPQPLSYPPQYPHQRRGPPRTNLRADWVGAGVSQRPPRLPNVRNPPHWSQFRRIHPGPMELRYINRVGVVH